MSQAEDIKLLDFKVSKPVKVKAFDACDQLSDNTYKLEGTVSRSEAIVLESVLRLYRREVGSLQQDELQLVVSLLTLQGKAQ